MNVVRQSALSRPTLTEEKDSRVTAGGLTKLIENFRIVELGAARIALCSNSSADNGLSKETL